MLIVVIGFIVVHYAFNMLSPQLREQFGSNMVNLSAEANETLQVSMVALEETTSIWDFVLVCLMVGLIIGIMLTAFLVDVHPAFTIIFFLIIVVATLLAIPLSNGFIEFENSAPAAMSSSLAAFPMSTFIMEQLPIFIASIGFVALIITYAKARRSTFE